MSTDEGDETSRAPSSADDAPFAATIEAQADAQTAPEPQQSEPSAPEEPSGDGPIVVGLGASAGGLEALQTFFANMPHDTGLAFVVVTHQPANRTSLLPMLLAKRTEMPVIEASEGLKIRENHVYIAPPGQNLGLVGGRLHLFELDDEAMRRVPINHFFRSLASDQRERAIGVVLSGTGTDGTLGLREIKGALGISIVQDEADAGFDGMPHSAIVGDTPDLVLPAAEIPQRLLAYARAMRNARTKAILRSDRALDTLPQVFALLRKRTGHNFAAYKESTVRRRVERRMNLHRLETIQEYVRFLQSHPNELDSLFDELLIGVTSFFRDPDAFERLGELLRELIMKKPDGYVLRVWSAGCSTGEEAYSLAMTVRECLSELGRDMPVQIFATDLDAKAIDLARAGLYPPGIAGDLSAKRLKRFFVQTDEGYQVRKELREMLVFAQQNLIEDPPFTKLDLLACRNLLIYLDASLQQRLFPIFHYVLKPGGLLFLGSSEALGQYSNLFELADKRWRLFRRREVMSGTYLADIPANITLDGVPHEPAPLSGSAKRVEVAASHVAERLLLRELVPPTVVMRERGEILHIHGRTGMFLEPAQGSQGSSNIYSMAREGLHLELAAAVRQAAREGDEVLRQGVQVKTNGHMIKVDLRIKRLLDPEPLRGLFRVSFERPRELDADARSHSGVDLTTPSRVLELERELQYTKESHQSTIEELETANEELKSTNEELQSTNEELQSANEELETSKEELQSLNEELQTVNVELQSKVEELSRANDDMTNLLNATDIATIFLDNDLNIKRHTEQAKRVIRLIPSDVGRPIGDLVSRLRYDGLTDDAREVLRTLAFKEVEVQGEGDEKWYLMRILPYRTTENMIDGLVVTFVDITRVKQLQQSEARLVHALRRSPVAVFALDADTRFTWAGSGVFGHEPASLTGKTFEEVFGEGLGEMAALLRGVRDSGTAARTQLDATVHGRAQRLDVYAQPAGSSATEKRAGITCVAVQLPR